jgi:hypothetical protein
VLGVLLLLLFLSFFFFLLLLALLASSSLFLCSLFSLRLAAAGRGEPQIG